MALNIPISYGPQTETDKDWFHYDPCDRNITNSIWYGDDIVSKIKDCKVKQEIGSHSFSHIMFGHSGCNSACAESDIKKWIEAASIHKIKPTSFVFPFNSEGHHDLLKKYGFKIYRSKNTDGYFKLKNKKIYRFYQILDRVLALTPSTSTVKKGHNNMLTIHGDFCYFRYKGIRNLFMWKSAVRKSKKGIDSAIKKGEVFHFWFHPFEIAENLDKSIQDLDEILNYAFKKINKGLLINKPMNQLNL